MPIKADYTWEIYNRLKSVGCSVQPPKSAGNASKLEMWQGESCWIADDQRGTLFLFELVLRVISPCCLERIDLMTPGWSPKRFHWLTPEEYRLFSEYPAERILNSVVDAHIKLETGRLLEGVLLGLAPEKIPGYYVSPRLIVTISAYDTLKNCTSVDCETVLDRSRIPQRPAKKREGLFAGGKIVLTQTAQPAARDAESPNREAPGAPATAEIENLAE